MRARSSQPCCAASRLPPRPSQKTTSSSFPSAAPALSSRQPQTPPLPPAPWAATPPLPPTALQPPIPSGSVMSATTPARPWPISTATAILISSSAIATATRWCSPTPRSATAPAYSAPATNPFGISDVGSYASPALADLDGDGDLDLFIGNSSGNTLVFTNTAAAGATAPAYSAPATNPFGISDVGYYASPAFADLDGDGDLDLFIGNERTATRWCSPTPPHQVPPLPPTALQPPIPSGSLMSALRQPGLCRSRRRRRS